METPGTSITVDRFDRDIQELLPNQKYIALGRADVTVDANNVLPGFKLKLRGIEAALIRGRPYLFPPIEEGELGVPWYFPLTGELRELLTNAVFQSQEVDAALWIVTELLRNGDVFETTTFELNKESPNPDRSSTRRTPIIPSSTAKSLQERNPQRQELKSQRNRQQLGAFVALLATLVTAAIVVAVASVP